MINNKTLEAAMPLVEILTNKGVRLNPIIDTPLYELVCASRPVQADVNGVEYSVYDVLNASKWIDPTTGTSPHDLAMDEVVDVVSRTISFNLDLARNVVNPIVKSAIAEIESFMGRAQTKMLQPLEIFPDIFSNPWDNPILESLVSPYEESPAYDIPGTPGMPRLQAETLKELVKTGIARFDSDMEAMIEAKGEDWLLAVYNTAFLAEQETVTESNEIVRLPELRDMLNRSGQFRDEILVVFCFTKRFATEVPDGATFTLKEFRDTNATIMSQTGRALWRVMKKRESDSRNNELIVMFPSFELDYVAKDGAKIVVNAEVYGRWLKDGGCPEILFGAYANGSRERGYKTLLENAEEFKEAWKRQERILATQVRFEKFNNLLEAIEYALALEITRASDDVMVVEEGLGADSVRAEMQTRLKEAMKNINAKDTDSLYCIVRKLVCRVMFPHTDAERVLCAIDTAAEANPDLDIREAALLATIEIVSDWVAEMIAAE